MSAEEELAAARKHIAELEEELRDSYQWQFDQARRLAVLHADELLACAVTIAGNQEVGDPDELDVALHIVREQAEQHGLLRRRPPRAVD